MPIRKFRSVADMERAQWREPGDPILYRTIAQLWQHGQRTARYRFPPGVYRHRSIDELHHREAGRLPEHVVVGLMRHGKGLRCLGGGAVAEEFPRADEIGPGTTRVVRKPEPKGPKGDMVGDDHRRPQNCLEAWAL